VIAFRAQRAHVKLVAHYPIDNAFALFILQGFDKREVSFHITIRHEVIRPFVPLLTYRVGRNKLQHFNIS
jgi:hypothetical protein